jgi:hypothetical protein
MAVTTRWGHRFPDLDGSNAPPDVPLWMSRLALDLDNVAKDDQGLADDRGTAASRKRGFIYKSTDTGAIERSDGSAWDRFVLDGDSRLTNVRTPSAHAASHKAAGSDAIRLDELAAPTAAVDMNSKRLTGVGTPTQPSDAVRNDDSRITGAAPLNSPGFTGSPTAPTPDPLDNDTSIATTEFVQAAAWAAAVAAMPFAF